jgi:hypothetical protein
VLDHRLEELLCAERHRDLCALLEQAREVLVSEVLVSEDQRTAAATTAVGATSGEKRHPGRQDDH